MQENVHELVARVHFAWGLFDFRHPSARLAMYRQLARFAERGYDVKVPLEVMRDRAVKRRRKTALVYSQLLRGLNEGRRFSDVLAPHVPNAERIAIASGEDAGRTGHGLSMAAYVVEASGRMRSALFSGLAYPALLLATFAALLVFVAWFLMPEMVDLYPVEHWPTASAALHWIATAVRGTATYFGIATVSVGVLVLSTLPSWSSGIRFRLDHVLPPWTIYREIQSGLLLVTVAGVVSAGAPIDDALRKIRSRASTWLGVHLDEMIRRVAQGQRPAHAMDTGLMSDGLMDELLAYDAAGDLANAMEALGKDSVDLVIQRIRIFAAALGGVLMLGVGIGLIWSWGSFVMVFMAMRNSPGGFS